MNRERILIQFDLFTNDQKKLKEWWSSVPCSCPEEGLNTDEGVTRELEGILHPRTRYHAPRCGATAKRRTRDRVVPGSIFACVIWFFSQARTIIGTARWLRLMEMLSPHNCWWAEPSQLFVLMARPTPLNCKNE